MILFKKLHRPWLKHLEENKNLWQLKAAEGEGLPGHSSVQVCLAIGSLSAVTVCVCPSVLFSFHLDGTNKFFLFALLLMFSPFLCWLPKLGTTEAKQHADEKLSEAEEDEDASSPETEE